MAFDAKRYWETRANPNAVGHDRAPRFIYDFVAPILNGKKTVLELGPGVGRMLDLYAGNQNVTTLDLSTSYHERVRARAEELGLTVTQCYLNSPSDRFDFEDNQFEIGVCIQVLMHVQPENIRMTIGELMRTCRQVVFVTNLRTSGGVHVFEHDYRGILAEIGGKILDFHQTGSTGCFNVTK